MNSEIYTVDYFIKKFEAIPDNKWVTGHFMQEDGKRCAIGHCVGPENQLPALIMLFNNNITASVVQVNDMGRAYHNGPILYPQPTPKERILAALYDIKAKIESEKVLTLKEEVLKEKVVYVTVDQAVRELQKKELCLQ